jgi:hypothetical protein
VVVIADISGGRPVLDNDPDEEVRLSFLKDGSFIWEEAAMVKREVVFDNEYSDKGCW